MPKLKALAVKNIKTSGRYSDDTHGLHLLVKPSGGKSWVQRMVVDGKRRDIGLGGYPAVSLQQARNLAASNAERRRTGQEVVSGRDSQKPARPKPEASKPTFSDLAMAYMARHEEIWSVNHARVARSALVLHVLPVLGSKSVDTISRTDVTGILEPLLTKSPAMAQKVRAILCGVLGDAEAKDLVTANHAGPVINRLMHGAGRVRKHQTSLPYDRVADALAAIDASETWPIIKLAMRFLALVAARPGEVRLARWDEVDWENHLWVVPAERMKSRREHRQPLAGAALDVLREAREWDTGHGWIFPTLNENGKKPLGKDTLTHTLHGLEIGATAHGFRSSFRTWAMEETDTPMEVAEAALSHSYGSEMVRSYARGTLLEKRRVLLEEWADFLALRDTVD